MLQIRVKTEQRVTIMEETFFAVCAQLVTLETAVNCEVRDDNFSAFLVIDQRRLFNRSVHIIGVNN